MNIALLSRRILAAIVGAMLWVWLPRMAVSQPFEPFLFAPHPFEENDAFGSSVAALGDLDRDGTLDYAVGVPGYDLSGDDAGAIWMLFMDSDGSVKNHRVLRGGQSGVPGAVADGDSLGMVLTPVGDIDDDGNPDVIVGFDGSLYVFFLTGNGRVREQQYLADGSAAAPIDDFNGDGITEIAVVSETSISVHFLNDEGQSTSSVVVALRSDYSSEIDFGKAISGAGDLNNDDIPDLAVAAKDAIWLFFLDGAGHKVGTAQLSIYDSVFSEQISVQDQFGATLAPGGDIDGDGIDDLLVGAPGTNAESGALWVLLMANGGSIKEAHPISELLDIDGSGIFPGDRFGSSVSTYLDASGTLVIVGAPHSDDGLDESGATWTFGLGTSLQPSSIQKVSNVSRGMIGRNETPLGIVGSSIVGLRDIGDINGDGVNDLMSLQWILFMDAAGRVIDQSRTEPGTPYRESLWERGGQVFAPNSFDGLGDFNDDGVDDIVTGYPCCDPAAVTGKVDLVMMKADGTEKSRRTIAPGFDGLPQLSYNTSNDNREPRFGFAVRNIGDIDNDGTIDIAVSAPYDTHAGSKGTFGAGAVYIILLNPPGSPNPIKHYSILLPAGMNDYGGRDHWGWFLGSTGDINGDGQNDLAIPDAVHGVTWIYFLNQDGQAISQKRLGRGSGGVDQWIDRDYLKIDDLDGDGIPELMAMDKTIFGTHMFFLGKTGGVRAKKQINNERGGTAHRLEGWIHAGSAPVLLNDLNGDGVREVAFYVTESLEYWEPARRAYLVFQVNIDLDLSIFVPSDSTIAVLGSDATISADIRDQNGVGIRTADILFRRAGGKDFLKGSMEPNGDGLWSYSLPAWTLSDSGMEYYISAENIGNQVARQPEKGVFSLTLHLDTGLEYPLSHGSEESGYRLLSVPLELDSTIAAALLEDDLGPYDARRWRFVDPTQSQLSPESELLEILPGRAYWILVRDANRRLTTGPGTTVATDEPFPIRLFQGWNYVGNPFNFPIPFFNVDFSSGTGYNIQSYKGSWAPVEGSMQPFEGYVAYNGQTNIDTLWIDPDVSSVPDWALGGTASKGGGSFAVQIQARLGGALDEDNYAVASTSASGAWDLLDRPEPPVVGDYVSVSFPHPEWQRYSRNFTSDARSVSTGGATWTFAVASKKPGPVELTFPDLGEVPEEYSIWLIDDLLQIRQDLRRAPVYVVSSGGEGAERALTLKIGTEAYLRGELQLEESIPTEFDLFQNFPNPFRGSTTIRYSVPVVTSVRVDVFDILGRRVATLANQSEEAGYHAIVWDGRGDSGATLGNGVYFARMRAGDFQKTLSITLLE